MDDFLRTRVIWHRRDLRITDNALYAAGPETLLIPLFIFDPEDFTARPSCSDAPHRIARVGPFAARFLLESVGALRERLRELGTKLFIRTGEPRQIVPEFLRELWAAGLRGPIEVVWHDEAGTYEATQAVDVRAALRKLSSEMPEAAQLSCSSFWGCTLWHPHNLAFYSKPKGQAQFPEVDLSPEAWHAIKLQGVQSFRRKAKATPIRSPLPAPSFLPRLPLFLTDIQTGNVPALSDLVRPMRVFGFTDGEVAEIIDKAQREFDPRSAHPFRGGEAAGLTHLAFFVNGLAEHCNREGGGDAGGEVCSSAKMSAYLAFGCLSPRSIHAFCLAREDRKANWLPDNMEMRDFWIFYALAHGRTLFSRDGDGPANLPASHWQAHNPTIWRRWLLGLTGLPLLDAAMIELRATGYTSNRCRQIPVSVLSNDLRMDWRAGAELYQWLLVDHDVSCNWGNWRYFAGVGCDPKRRHYKALSQGLRYDPDASLVKTWLPQLRTLSAREAHLIPIQRARTVAADEACWPEPVVDALRQLNWEDQQSLASISGVPAESLHKGKGRGKAKGSSSLGKHQSFQDVENNNRTEDSTRTKAKNYIPNSRPTQQSMYSELASSLVSAPDESRPTEIKKHQATPGIKARRWQSKAAGYADSKAMGA